VSLKTFGNIAFLSLSFTIPSRLSCVVVSFLSFSQPKLSATLATISVLHCEEIHLACVSILAGRENNKYLILLWYKIVTLSCCVFKKDDSGEQSDAVDKSQETSAVSEVDDNVSDEASSPELRVRQPRHQSAYGAWQTVQQDT